MVGTIEVALETWDDMIKGLWNLSDIPLSNISYTDVLLYTPQWQNANVIAGCSWSINLVHMSYQLDMFTSWRWCVDWIRCQVVWDGVVYILYTLKRKSLATCKLSHLSQSDQSVSLLLAELTTIWWKHAVISQLHHTTGTETAWHTLQGTLSGGVVVLTCGGTCSTTCAVHLAVGACCI